jgi:nitrate reductase cytochrome c-type subunit
MDDRIGTLIYIVLLIIIGIAQAFRKNKKKAEMAEKRYDGYDEENLEEMPQDERRRDTSFESIFEKFEEALTGNINEEQIPNKEIAFEEEPVKESLTEEYNRVKVTQEKMFREDYRKKPPVHEIENIHVSDSAGSAMADLEFDQYGRINIHELFKDGNDLKKAVVLSEIINRKY